MSTDPDLLIAAAVDGALDDAQAAELAALVRRDPAVARSLRLHLVISDVAGQELVPARGVAAFAAGLAERRRAQDDGAAFLARVRARIAAEDRVAAVIAAAAAAPPPAPDPVPTAPARPAAAAIPAPPSGLAWWPAAAAAAILVGALLAWPTAAAHESDASVGSVDQLIRLGREQRVYRTFDLERHP